jgi:hypothetical protein
MEDRITRIHNMILALDRCKCEKCQKAKKQWKARLLLNNEYADEQPPVEEDSMQGINDVEYWRTKAHDYEWMFKEQQDICKGYREIIEELQQQLKKLHIEKAMRNQSA